MFDILIKDGTLPDGTTSDMTSSLAQFRTGRSDLHRVLQRSGILVTKPSLRFSLDECPVSRRRYNGDKRQFSLPLK
ncbi:hypothetical protein [Ruegeria sp. HKCCD8929]|uniref:hypothetical protein n=1 Tax=Ruegeria sp. HKCCD8929 TaxID=2683006 RepID=UPI001487E246|nr:hypothetical protein [Ruegeria sp. HKCCD8929]